MYNHNQRWFYKKEMKSDEVILFKLGDSETDEAQCKNIVPDIYRRLLTL